MRSTVRTLVVVAVAAVLLFLFRAIALTVYTITDTSLTPSLVPGDRVLVNRWSYGFRIGGNSVISYTRIGRRPVKKGDFIAFDAPVADSASTATHVMIGRVTAVPGDTIQINRLWYVIPRGCQVCTCNCPSSCIVDSRSHGGQMLVPEQDIIGRAMLVIYRFDKFQFDRTRWLQTLR